MNKIRKNFLVMVRYPAILVLNFKRYYLLHPLTSRHNKIRKTMKFLAWCSVSILFISLTTVAFDRHVAAIEAIQKADTFESQVKDYHNKFGYMLDGDDEQQILSLGLFRHPLDKPNGK